MFVIFEMFERGYSLHEVNNSFIITKNNVKSPLEGACAGMKIAL